MPGNFASTGSTILVSDSALLFYALLAIPAESVVVSRETLLGNRRGELWRWPKGRLAWPNTSSFKAAAKLAAGPARRSRFLANARIEKPTQQWANTVRMMLLGSSLSLRLPTIEIFTFARSISTWTFFELWPGPHSIRVATVAQVHQPARRFPVACRRRIASKGL